MPLDSVATRFQFRFRAYLYRPIRLCLADSQGAAATILLCCAVDLLARYYSGQVSHTLSKARYVAFLRRFFPAAYNPDSFYGVVRSGLVHAFSMERRYVILCRDDSAARAAHLQRDLATHGIILNPFMLFEHLDAAFHSYLHALGHDAALRAGFRAVHRVWPLKQQQIRWRKARPSPP